MKNKTLTGATFLETKSKEDQNHLDIYTDGSTCKTTKKTTCAVNISATQTKEAWLLSNFTNSFNAELAAIKQVLTLTYNQDWNEITIYTESKSAIQAISNFKWKSRNYIPEIIQQINNFRSAGTKIYLYWIPGHAGIRGKEIADQLANNRRTADDGETMCHTPNMAEQLMKIKNKFQYKTLEKLKKQFHKPSHHSTNKNGGGKLAHPQKQRNPIRTNKTKKRPQQTKWNNQQMGHGYPTGIPTRMSRNKKLDARPTHCLLLRSQKGTETRNPETQTSF